MTIQPGCVRTADKEQPIKPDMFNRPTAVSTLVAKPNHQPHLRAKFGVLGALIGTIVILAQPLPAQQWDVKTDYPFLVAVQKGDLNAVKNLIRKGVNVNVKDTRGFIVWHQVFFQAGGNHRGMNRNEVELAKFLINNGVDVNAKDAGGTALMAATLGGTVELVKLLIEKGADVNAKDEVGQTALIIAVKDSEVSEKNKIIKLLIEKGVDVNATDDSGRTAAQYAEKAPPEIKDLLKPIQKPAAGQSAATPETGSVPSTPAPAATTFHCVGPVEAFDANQPSRQIGTFVAGSDLELKEVRKEDGMVPVTYRSPDGKVIEAVCRTQAVGMATKTKTNDALTASQDKVSTPPKGVMVPAPAPEAMPIQINFPLCDAMQRADLKTMEHLIKKGANMNGILFQAVALLNPDITRGTDIESNPSKRVRVIKFLIDKGADVNWKQEDGFTVLMAATNTGNVEIVKLLIEKGANVNVVSNNTTVLMDALQYTTPSANVAMIKLLIEKGAEVNAKMSNGTTVLMHATGLALESGKVEILKLLLQKGADPNTKDDQGRTAADYARDKPAIQALLNTKPAQTPSANP